MSKSEKQIYSVLVFADKSYSDSESFFVAATTPEAARARATIEFEKLFPDRIAHHANALPIGPESAFAPGDDVSLTFGGQTFTYKNVGLLGSLADGTKGLTDRDKRRRKVLR